MTAEAIHNAMTVHAAVGGSTNLLLHVPAIAHAAGLRRPTVEEWSAVNRRVPRLVDVPAQRPATPRSACSWRAECRRSCSTSGGWACSTSTAAP